ncbi:MAG: glycerol-3-phosphate 1-O-acyltransferase PlsY [Gammaproteobacteria bacterium]|nr:glycerol-3-phosphate 1-O-acyltransferase PlsY [Gammaproteobacteria bacterium]
MEQSLLLVLFAYLLGSLSAAIIICRLMGLPDPRTVASKNPGATNVLRIGGKKAAALTLLGDFLKGLIPVLLGVLLAVEPRYLALIGLAAFLGHLFPLFFAFKGGKGVATALGVMLGISWQLAVAAVLTWMIVARLSRISSLSALVAALLAPLYGWYLDLDNALLLLLMMMSLLLMVRHHGNIKNLLAGTEKRIGG